MYRHVAWILAIAMAALPGVVQAQTRDWYVAPTVGATTGGDTTSTGTLVGLAAGWMSSGLFSLDAELTHAPNFFEQDGFRTRRDLTTVMGHVNVAFGSADAIVRPFVTGGAGVLMPRLSEPGGFGAIDVTDVAYQVGVGMLVGPRDRVGLRADVRYVRAAGDSAHDANAFGLEVSRLRFWRVSTALVVGF